MKLPNIEHRAPLPSGALRCTLEGDRVSIAGHAVLYLEGRMTL
jgi:hypothetical protein